ncbi:MAG: SEC-C metal-binding domain-containing protein, partial [Halanaerobium sp.]|nr:SEC-C metal-binding domain-containing protein [Halanaerobium sp.]
AYQEKEEQVGEVFHKLEKYLALEIIDRKWMDHLDAMDDLRQGISLRAYGQRDPLTEYKFESFELFQNMTSSIREEIVSSLFKVQIVDGDIGREGPREMQTNRQDDGTDLNFLFRKVQQAGLRRQRQMQTNQEEDPPQRKPVVKGDQPGRNDPCPCGSGKKYKYCCGR